MLSGIHAFKSNIISLLDWKIRFNVFYRVSKSLNISRFDHILILENQVRPIHHGWKPLIPFCKSEAEYLYNLLARFLEGDLKCVKYEKFNKHCWNRWEKQVSFDSLFLSYTQYIFINKKQYKKVTIILAAFNCSRKVPRLRGKGIFYYT